MNELIYIAALPVILICIYVYTKDKEKEPKKLLGKLMLWGVFSIIPVIVIELILDNFFKITGNESLIIIFLYCFIGVGLVEEFAKWIISYKVVYKNNEFNESYDAIVYSVFVSLGFALIENILYVLSNGIITGVIRAFTAVPTHTCTGIVMGYYLGLAKLKEVNNEKNESNKYMLFSILIPILIHTIYDSLAFSKEASTLLQFISFTILLYIISIVTIKKVSKNNYKFNNLIDNNDNFKFAIKNIIIITIIVVFLSILLGGL